MSELTDVQDGLGARLRSGKLALDAGVIAYAPVAAFLRGLPGGQLVVDLGTSGAPTVDGTGFPQTLTVTGSIAGSWAVPGTAGRSVEVAGVTLVLTQADADAAVAAALTVSGRLSWGTRQLAATGSLTDLGRLAFALRDPAGAAVSLVDVAEFMAPSTLADSLPTGTEAFGGMNLTDLRLEFSLDPASPTDYSAALDAGASRWTVVTDRIELSRLSAALRSTLTPWGDGQVMVSYSGAISGILTIGQDYTVVVGFGPGGTSRIEVIPSQGNVLPALSDLATFVGGDGLRASVEAGVSALGLGAISVDGVTFWVDPVARSLNRVSIRSHLSAFGARLDLFTSLPDFQIGGSLAPSSSLSIRDLIGRFFTVADQFPALRITDFSFFAAPGQGRYSLGATVEDVWSIVTSVGQIDLENLGLTIERSAQEVIGSVSCGLALAGTRVFLEAAKTQADGGWDLRGATPPGQAIPIGTIAQDLASKLGIPAALPSPVAALAVDVLSVSFNTTTRDFTFLCEADLPIDGQSARIALQIDVLHNDRGYTRHLGGRIAIAELEFDLELLQDAQGGSASSNDTLVATYLHTGRQDLKSLLSGVSTTVAGYIPDALQIDIRDIIFAYNTGPAGSSFLFGLDIDVKVTPSLSDLPLVGRLLPSDRQIALEDLTVIVASKVIEPALAGTINALLPSGVAPLPTGEALGQGAYVSADLDLGGAAPLALSVPITGGSSSPPPAPPEPGVTPSDNARWYLIQKSFGPVSFQRIGFKYEDGAAWFLLDASLSFAGLSLSLDGLAFGSTLSPFSPRFDLRGIGIDYAKGPVEIGGALLRVSRTDGEGQPYDEYDGVAVIRTKALTLSALASYTELGGDPSLFIYAVLDYPLGGPAFFFVTGLTAGVGYNRGLIVPAIDQVADFPLVKFAATNAPAPRTTDDLTTVLNGLARYVPPRTGAIFFAIGVKFTSFKMVDAFAMLAVSLGDPFEVNVLGLATLVAPPPVAGVESTVPPLAVVQMALKAGFQPSIGLLSVAAQLTSESYLFSRSCRLTGGFAFFSWFAGTHQGDFVLSVGGYHPGYSIPDHYPRVPRLGFNWQVNDQLVVKGDAYYALTAAHLMAGGHLQMTYASGKLRAWFTAGADLLVAWKPFHYDAKMHVNVGATYTYSFFGTHTISVDLSADLHLWGPEFSGTMTIDLDIVSFDVKFGAGSSAAPGPITWSEFKGSFLPADGSICGVALTDGLLRSAAAAEGAPTSVPGDALDLGAVEPKALTLVVNSVIPSTTARVRGVAIDRLTFDATAGVPVALSVRGGTLTPQPPPGTTTRDAPVVAFGVGPMGVAVGGFASAQSIEITRDGAPAEDGFLFTPILKDVPTGLWGDWGRTLRPPLNGPRFVAGTLAGFAIRPSPPVDATATQSLDAGRLLLDTVTASPPFAWATGGKAFRPDPRPDAARLVAIREGILAPATAAARAGILRALGIDPATVQLDAQQIRDMTAGFEAAPELATT